MKKLESFFSRHRRLAAAVVFLTFAVLGGCIFPVHNLTRPESNYTPWIHLYLAASIFAFCGQMDHRIFPNGKFISILALNLGVTLAGMAFRYLLEWGEVSNTYNFTLPNITLHIAFAVIVSTLSWYWTAYKKQL